MIGFGGGKPVVRFADEYWFPVSPARMWEILDQVERYPTWWAWLRDFAAAPVGAGLTSGTVLRGTVVPPVPYRLSVQVTFERCAPPALVEATVDGDLRGTAMLELTAAGDGTTASVAWTLQILSPPLRVAARVALPLVRWGHDQVVARAVAGFRRHALAQVVPRAEGPP